jgi:hypothetical protein
MRRHVRGSWRWIAERLRGQGYTVQQELPVGGGKTIDLVATREGTRIAYEIETGHSDAAANVEKCLAAGMERVVVVVTSGGLKQKLEAASWS